MKRILFFFAFVLLAGGISAQKQCTKKCTAAEKAACAKAGVKCVVVADDASATDVASALAEAELAAEGNESISKKVCSKSGAISFYSKSTCAKSGKVSMEEVMYDTGSKAFVNVSPKDMMNQEAKVVKAASKESKTAKKACCKGKKACSKTKEGA